MDSQQDPPSFSLKILVDKELQKAVVAEATSDFVDTLFSFLTLPLGTIIRLVGKKDLQHPALVVSINNLYQSVENLDTDNFLNDVCKNMLLNPQNPCHDLCSRLLVNVDNTEPSKSPPSVSPYRPIYRGKLIVKGKRVPSSEAEAKTEVFVKGGSKFLVFDDLKVMPSSFDLSLQLLIQLGYRDFSRLEETFINIGLQEILKLLKNVLISCEPLTNTFLEKDNKNAKEPRSSPFKIDAKSYENEDECKMDVKVICSKSKNKIMCIEAKEDFVDVIFGFLTVPLGSILKLLGGNSCAGCVDNLYNSVGCLDKRWCTDSHSVLMDPGVTPPFSCPYPKQLLNSLGFCEEDAVGFVKRPTSYVVEDDLRVSPLRSSSMLSFLKEFNLPFDDIEVSVLRICEEEALNLLRASLTSKSALNDGLADFLEV